MKKAALACAALLASVPAAARADGPRIGLGVVGGYGGVYLPATASNAYAKDGLTLPDASYPGFHGWNGRGGVSVEGRWSLSRIRLGVEIDAMYSLDRGQGDLAINRGVEGADYVIVLGQHAVHVPLLAKAELPLSWVSPFAALGPEFIFSGSPSLTATPNPAFATSAYGSSLVIALTAGLGAEVKLPFEAIDLRIPLSFRASFAPASGTSLADRETVEVSDRLVTEGRQYRTVWRYTLLGTAGLSWWL